jgi:HupF/HypC family
VTSQPLPPPVHRDRPAVSECHDGVCVTCSDAAVQVRVRELLDDDLAVVETDAGLEEVSVALVEVRPGDLVLVHAKEAIAIVEALP